MVTLKSGPQQASSTRAQGTAMQEAMAKQPSPSVTKNPEWGLEVLLQCLTESLGQAHMRVSDLTTLVAPILLDSEETNNPVPPIAQAWDPTPLNLSLEEQLRELDRLNQRLAYVSRRISL